MDDTKKPTHVAVLFPVDLEEFADAWHQAILAAGRIAGTIEADDARDFCALVNGLALMKATVEGATGDLEHGRATLDAEEKAS